MMQIAMLRPGPRLRLGHVEEAPTPDPSPVRGGGETSKPREMQQVGARGLLPCPHAWGNDVGEADICAAQRLGVRGLPGCCNLHHASVERGWEWGGSFSPRELPPPR